MISRRTFLELLAAVQAVGLAPAAAETADAPSKLSFGPPSRFDFESLKAMAADLAGAPYAPPPMPDPAIVQTMNFDTAKHILPDPDHALFGDGRGPYPVSLLAVGQLFPKTVRMFMLAGGEAREILFRADYFKSPEGGPLSRLPTTPSPFAGLEFLQAYDKPSLRGHEGWGAFHRRLVLPRRRRGRPVRRFRAGRGPEQRHCDPRGIPRLHAFLGRRGGDGRRSDHAVRAPRRAKASSAPTAS